MIFGFTQDYTGLPDLPSFVFYIFAGVLCAFLLKKGAGFSNRPGKNAFNPWYFILWAALTVFSAYRSIGDHVGGSDIDSYLVFFCNVERVFSVYWDTFKMHDPLQFCLFRASKLISPDFRVLLLICYGFMSFVYIAFADTYGKDKDSFLPYIVIAVIVYKSFASLRTGLAIAFVLLGLTVFKKHKLAGFVIALISLGLHFYTAVFAMAFFVFWVIFRNAYKWSRKKLCCLVIGFTAAGITVAWLLRQVNWPEMYYTFIAYYRYAIDAYMNSGSGKSLYESLILRWPMYFCHMLLLAAMVVFWDKLRSEDNAVLITVCLFDIIMIPAMVMINNWRAGDYFCLARLVMWAQLIRIGAEYVPSLFKKMYKPVCACAFGLWLVFRLYSDYDDLKIMPYSMSFSPIYEVTDVISDGFTLESLVGVENE